MKTVRLNKSFKKDFEKLRLYQKQAWAEAFGCFIENPWGRILRRHKLSGQYHRLESIDVLPNLRGVFLETENEFVFYHIGNHNQLYG